MSKDVIPKKIKSFSLKVDNAEKVERIAYERKTKQSSIVDDMIEVYEDGNT